MWSQTASLSTSWELVRNSNSRAPAQTHWSRNSRGRAWKCGLRSPREDADARLLEGKNHGSNLHPSEGGVGSTALFSGDWVQITPLLVNFFPCWHLDDVWPQPLMMSGPKPPQNMASLKCHRGKEQSSACDRLGCESWLLATSLCLYLL